MIAEGAWWCVAHFTRVRGSVIGPKSRVPDGCVFVFGGNPFHSTAKRSSRQLQWSQEQSAEHQGSVSRCTTTVLVWLYIACWLFLSWFVCNLYKTKCVYSFHKTSFERFGGRRKGARCAAGVSRQIVKFMSIESSLSNDSSWRNRWRINKHAERMKTNFREKIHEECPHAFLCIAVSFVFREPRTLPGDDDPQPSPVPLNQTALGARLLARDDWWRTSLAHCGG